MLLSLKVRVFPDYGLILTGKSYKILTYLRMFTKDTRKYSLFKGLRLVQTCHRLCLNGSLF